MSMDGELQKHYALLLGIGSPWEAQLAAMSRGVPAANFPLFATTDLLSLQAEAAGIAAHEAQR